MRHHLIPGFKHDDLLKIPPEKLDALASEVREMIIDTVTENGGHLGSSLGVVELTIAMLRCFNPVNDRIIFDVGHQSYPYKILTDRADRFSTLRMKDGICGFPRRSESPCDHFNTGHSSTSISAALGFARARDMAGEDRHIVAFIGDASLINGLALEALNYVHETRTKLIIVLNDNKHSISARVGGFSTLLARLSANTPYNRIKSAIKSLCSVLPLGDRIQRRLEGLHGHIKNLLKPNNIFDDLDINYWGPFDGHDIAECTEIFELAKRYDRPVLLHFNTVKGKGMPEAEADPTKYHQVSPRPQIPHSDGRTPAQRGGRPGTDASRAAQNRLCRAQRKCTWSDAASAVTEELAEADDRIVCFTAAMSTGVKLEHFRKRFPERFFDVGIAESHMLTMAAGMAAGGAHPWVFIYSTFLQRAMDQLVHDIALQNLPVVLMVDRAGLVGSDGDTHQGLLDVSWARPVPNLEVYAPADEPSLRRMMIYASRRNGPTMIRYPRGSLPKRIYSAASGTAGSLGTAAFLPPPTADGQTEIRPKATVLREGAKWLLLGHGVTTHIMLEAADIAVKTGMEPPCVVDLQQLSPLDADFIDGILKNRLCRRDENFSYVAVAEDNYTVGGVGEAVARRIAESRPGCAARLRLFGVPGVCVPHALPEEQREMYGLTADNIVRAMRDEEQDQA